MAVKKKKPAGNSKKRSPPAKQKLFGYAPSSWTLGAAPATSEAARQGRRGFAFYFGRRDEASFARALAPHLHPWQLELWEGSDADALHAAGKNGPVWAFRPPLERPKPGHEGKLDRSSYARARDQVGSIVAPACAFGLERLIVDFHSSSVEEEMGAFVGFELGAYAYAEACGRKSPREMPKLFVAGGLAAESERDEARAIGEAVNLARHLVNVPPGDLNPRSYADQVKALFKGSAVHVEIWDPAKLARERMNLLLAVGAGAVEGPRLVRLSYRPKRSPPSVRPIAVVGKGITFDSGGLDIKPSSGMRLMKKDMGGSAAVVGLMRWAERVGFDAPLEGYLALAENAVDARSFHPSDVIESRAGTSVEIHNTDAEGRLVLADAMNVAVTQATKPIALIDVATLTGAIKVALGADIAGLFCNDDGLADAFEGAAQATGDLVWRMPLFQSYKSSLRSNFADIANATDGFGGAITAALFLESFAGGVPWAHLDVYAWRDSASGAFAEGGGSGQPVQALIEAVRRISVAR